MSNRNPNAPSAKSLARWRPKLPALRQRGRLSRPLAAAGAATALVAGGVVAALALGGVILFGLAALAVGAIMVGAYWFRAKRNGIWVHVLVDTDDAVISLALPLPLALLRQALEISPASDDATQMAQMILEDPELMKALREDAIEITLDDGSDHIEVLIGGRRKHWRAFQFHFARSFSQNQSLFHSEEINHG